MALNSLQQALQQHERVLGPALANLGKQRGVYLSYDRTGWSIVQFSDGIWGWIQQILRTLGLYYRSTRLEIVASQLQKEPQVPPVLLDKIQSAWRRHKGEEGPLQVFSALEVEPKQRVVLEPNHPDRFGFYLGADQHTCLTVERGDILNPGTKAIVNAANPSCLGGGGIDGVIHRAAGPGLRRACERLPQVEKGVRCPVGSAVLTSAYGRILENNVSKIIHAVGPVYDGTTPEKVAESRRKLQQTYISILALARQVGVRSVAIPAISTGIYGYPFEKATKEATLAIRKYVEKYPGFFNEIKLIFTDDRFPLVRPLIFPEAQEQEDLVGIDF